MGEALSGQLSCMGTGLDVVPPVCARMYNAPLFCYFQSTRLIIYVVPEPAEVSALYSVAQLQVDDSQTLDSRTASSTFGPLLLCYAGIHRQENIQCLTL